MLAASAWWCRLFTSVWSRLPGLLLTCTIAAAAFALRGLSGIAVLSPPIIAIALGIAFHNTVDTPAMFKSGVVFSMRRILRVGIVLLGLQLSLAQAVTVGTVGVVIIAATLAATFAFTVWLGRQLGMERKLAELIGAGTSICGASAIIATNAVTSASEEDVAYAVACVTVLGSVSALLYPALGDFLQLMPHEFGLWAGASIHEIAQVVAAAFQNGPDAGNFGTIAKLCRVMLLAPIIMVLSYSRAKRRQTGDSAHVKPRIRRAAPMPWFVLGFIAMMLVNSLDVIPPAAKIYLVQATTFLLTVALAAMGLETDFAKLREKGWKPLFLGAGSWLFISALSLALIELVYN
jgi:uncharacterized integral membrane protein (TIGR00698 family)